MHAQEIERKAGEQRKMEENRVLFCIKMYECSVILLTENLNKDLKTTSNSDDYLHAPLFSDTLFHLNIKSSKNLSILHIKFQHNS